MGIGAVQVLLPPGQRVAHLQVEEQRLEPREKLAAYHLARETEATIVVAETLLQVLGVAGSGATIKNVSQETVRFKVGTVADQPHPSRWHYGLRRAGSLAAGQSVELRVAY